MIRLLGIRAKPRITRVAGRWVCSSVHSSAAGRTPVDAYGNWRRQFFVPRSAK